MRLLLAAILLCITLAPVRSFLGGRAGPSQLLGGAIVLRGRAGPSQLLGGAALLRWPWWLLRISACATALILGTAIVLGGRAGPSQLLGGAAWAHGDADWINQGGFKNAAGELCCGERDCVVVHAQHVTLPEPGYRVFETGELVPERDAQPSPDGQFWRCQWGGVRKCFFAPPEAN